MLIRAPESVLLVVDVQERLVPAIHDHGNVVDGIEWLIGVAGEVGVPVLATEQYPRGLGRTVDQLGRYLAPEAVAEKTAFSAADEPACHDLVAGAGRRQVVICGIEAHVCVLQTALGLHHAGYEVFVAGDVAGSRNPRDRDLALDRIRALGVQVVSREMVAFEWLQRAGTDVFREVSRRFLR
ncbi:hydrolase [Arhodomonas aquaeolei]|uniref:hydrolase n=1 Tax=Arhodomonas aquaeolei TaxID=2369 RepID=UPI000365CEA6|nr:hydrolase [Arhodomonas aquaeolei]